MARSLTTEKKSRIITFRYTAYTVKGDLVKGNIKAGSEIEAERLIISKGYNPEHLEPAPSMFSLEEALPSLFQIKQREIIIFSRQLATLLRSGISLLPALEILEEQTGVSRGFGAVLRHITNDIRSGSSFSQSISKHRKAFDDVYCRTIAVAEESGSLVTVLNRMADYLEKQSAVGKKIGKALTYPIIILVAGVVVVIILITVVMPGMMSMFTAMSVDLPLPTKILMAVTDFVGQNPVPLLVVAAVIAIAILYFMKQPTGRRIMDNVKLNAPVIGPPTLMSELGRIARTMSVLVGAGLKLQEIMELIPRSSSNKVIQLSLKRVQEALFLGEGLSGPMSREKILPSLFVQMVAVGEESNTLEFSMEVVADFYEASAEDRTAAMVGMIGPISTISIALLVGFIAVSVLMPMYTITGAFG